MEYRPRIDCSDTPTDSDDYWLTRRGVHDRVDKVLRSEETTTVGIAEVPLALSTGEIDRRIARWESRLRHLGRVQDVEDDTVFHWTVAELIAFEALHAWWSAIAEWPLGWWPWAASGEEPPLLPPKFARPAPFSITTSADDGLQA